MTSYPQQEDDAQRVAFLHDLSILDTAPDANLDRIVRLCRHIFDVPVANISLVDAERQWFKSIEGLDVCETDRELAFCNYTILGDDVFEVLDATLDPNFRDNPLVTGPPHIRYYAGAPIVYDGRRLGALCLIDFAPRPPLSAVQVSVLRDLADVVIREMKVQRLMRESLARLTVDRDPIAG